MGIHNKVVNRWRLLSNYIRRKPSFSDMPSALVIEATNRCDLNCIMCPREVAASHPCDMSLSLFKRIIDQSMGAVEFVDLSFRGEPLLNGDIFAMIEYVKTRGLRTSLQTNGMLLDGKKCRALLESKLDLLTVSIDAFSSDTYKKIRTGGDFHLVVENVKRMVALKKEFRSNMTIAVQVIPMKENKEELEDFKGYWKKYKHVLVRTKPFSTRGGLFKNNLVSLEGEGGHLARCRCSRIWNSMFIYADGTVVPCCNDFLCQHPLGDLNAQSVADVWKGPAMLGLRQKHASREFDAVSLCKNCEVLGISFHKHLATFLLDDLTLRKLLIRFDLSY